MKYYLTLLGLFSVLNGSAQLNNSKIFSEYQKDKSILPDFSYVGYKRGEVQVPDVVLKEFNVTKFGAVADDERSDKEAIIKAIKAAAKNGGGIVYFPKGRFLINEDGDDLKSIWISASNIVLRGSGSGPGGTEIFMKNSLQPSDPNKMWSVPPMFIIGGNKSDEEVSYVSGAAKTGAFEIKVKDAGDLEKGQWITLEMRSADSDLIKGELGRHDPDPGWTDLVKKGVYVKVYHQIKSIKKNTLVLEQPLTFDIEEQYEWKVSRLLCVEEMGIEDIAFKGNWKDKFVHHRSWIDDSGWTILNFRRAVNSWLRNCSFTDVSVAATVSSGANISVYNCEIEGNGGHEAISNAGGTNIFLGKIVDHASMWHSVGTSKTSMNTVIWRVQYPSTTSFESHASQPRNTLLDKVEGGLMTNRGGGAFENMPNHLKNLVFWNYRQTNEAYTDFEFWPASKWWKIPDPIIVGFHGAATTFKAGQVKYLESLGREVFPESLYEAQLKLRLGKLPVWIEKLKQDKLN